MKKEILKYEDLGKDIEHLYSTHFNRLHIIYTISLALPFLIILFIMLLTSDTASLIMLTIVAAIIIVPFLAARMGSKKIKSIIQKNGYNVVKGKLLSTKQDYNNFFRRTFLSPYNYIFTFSVGEWAVIPSNFSYRFNVNTRHLYSWSKEMAMTFEGIYNTSVSGDEFYIVVDGVTQNILCAYNTKFFKLENE